MDLGAGDGRAAVVVGQMIAHGGVLPNIQAVLLPKKTQNVPRASGSK